MNLQTKRLTIRPFQQGDLEDLYAIYGNEDTCRFLLHSVWREENKEEKFSEKLEANLLTPSDPLSLACVYREKVIGDLSIWYTGMKDTLEIGFSFNPPYGGQGFATEALRAVMEYLFLEKNIHRIQANLDARNAPSAALCQRVGMRREAHFLQDYWNKGEWPDSYVYGMLASDLKEKVNGKHHD